MTGFKFQQTVKWGGKRRTIVRQRVNRVSNKVFNAATVSSKPSSPFNLLRLNRMYQLVSSSIRAKSRGIMVYRR